MPGAGLGFLAALQAHLIEKDFADLLGTADIKGLAGDLMRFRFVHSELLFEHGGQAGQLRAVDLNAFIFHLGHNSRHAPIDIFIDARDLRGGQFGLEEFPKAERDVCIFCGVTRGIFQADLIKGLLVFSRPRDLFKRHRAIAEMRFGERVHTVTVQTVRLRIGN